MKDMPAVLLVVLSKRDTALMHRAFNVVASSLGYDPGRFVAEVESVEV